MVKTSSLVIKCGDILDEEVDVLFCSANPMLNMSGGVNGTILQRGGASVQAELREFIAKKGGPKWVLPCTVVKTGPGPLPVKHILHCVAIDGFYKSSHEMVVNTLTEAFEQAIALEAKTIAVPALATGFGPLSVTQFAQALKETLEKYGSSFREIRFVLFKESHLKEAIAVFQ